MRIVDKIKENLAGFRELEKEGLYSYHLNGVHINKNLFIKLANELPVRDISAILDRDSKDYPYELYLQHQGIEYFMIFDESEYDEMLELVSEWNDDIS